MIKALIVKKLAVLAISAAASTAIPFLIQDRPRLVWVWDRIGPRVVDAAKVAVDDHLSK